MSGKPYFVYVLWSVSGKCFYIGMSEDITRRLQQHNSGLLKSWTARYRPWEIVYSEYYPDYRSAKKRENQLKAQKGGAGFFHLTGLDPTRFDRAVS